MPVKTFFLWIFLLSLINVQISWAGPTIDCSSFWAKGFPDPSITTSYPCRLFFDTASAPVELYRYEKGWSESAAEVSALNNLAQALNETIPLLSKWGWLRPVKLILVNFLGTKEEAYAELFSRHPASEEEPLPIIIYQDVLSFKPEVQKQILAHELFHAWQNTQHPSGTYYASASWWMEGSADFFSNLVYPATNYEYRTLEEFDFNSSLIDQKSPYTTWLFFQSLANSYIGESGVKYILNVLGKNDSAFRFKQYEALNSVSSIGLHFHRFQEEFALAKIQDQDGNMVPTGYRPRDTWTLTGAEATHKAKVHPFAFNGIRVELPPGGTNQFRLSAEEGVEASFLRSIDSKSFEPFLADYPYEIDTACKAKPSPSLFIFSAASPKSDPKSAEVRFKFEAKDCGCKDSPVELPSCWTGAFALDEDSMRSFMREALKPNTLTDLKAQGELRIDPTGRIQLIPGEILARVKVLKTDSDDPEKPPIVIEYGPIAGLTRAKMALQPENKVCFRDIETDLWAFVKIYFGDEVLKQGYPIEAVDPDGLSVRAICNDQGIRFEKEIAREGGSLKFDIVFHRK
jgi:hypothetical protein